METHNIEPVMAAGARDGSHHVAPRDLSMENVPYHAISGPESSALQDQYDRRRRHDSALGTQQPTIQNGHNLKSGKSGEQKNKIVYRCVYCSKGPRRLAELCGFPEKSIEKDQEKRKCMRVDFSNATHLRGHLKSQHNAVSPCDEYMYWRCPHCELLLQEEGKQSLVQADRRRRPHHERGHCDKDPDPAALRIKFPPNEASDIANIFQREKVYGIPDLKYKDWRIEEQIADPQGYTKWKRDRDLWNLKAPVMHHRRKSSPRQSESARKRAMEHGIASSSTKASTPSRSRSSKEHAGNRQRKSSRNYVRRASALAERSRAPVQITMKPTGIDRHANIHRHEPWTSLPDVQNSELFSTPDLYHENPGLAESMISSTSSDFSFNVPPDYSTESEINHDTRSSGQDKIHQHESNPSYDTPLEPFAQGQIEHEIPKYISDRNHQRGTRQSLPGMPPAPQPRPAVLAEHSQAAMPQSLDIQQMIGFQRLNFTGASGSDLGRGNHNSFDQGNVYQEDGPPRLAGSCQAPGAGNMEYQFDTNQGGYGFANAPRNPQPAREGLAFLRDQPFPAGMIPPTFGTPMMAQQSTQYGATPTAPNNPQNIPGAFPIADNQVFGAQMVPPPFNMPAMTPQPPQFGAIPNTASQQTMGVQMIQVPMNLLIAMLRAGGFDVSRVFRP